MLFGLSNDLILSAIYSVLGFFFFYGFFRSYSIALAFHHATTAGPTILIDAVEAFRCLRPTLHTLSLDWFSLSRTFHRFHCGRFPSTGLPCFRSACFSAALDADVLAFRFLTYSLFFSDSRSSGFRSIELVSGFLTYRAWGPHRSSVLGYFRFIGLPLGLIVMRSTSLCPVSLTHFLQCLGPVISSSPVLHGHCFSFTRPTLVV